MAMPVQAEVIPVSAGSEKLWKRFRTARLRALHEYPYAFSSTYENESRFEDEVWVKRLQNPDAKQVAAIRSSASSQATAKPITDTEKLAENEWIGMIVPVGPRLLPPDGSESMTPWKPFTDPNRASPTASALAGQEAAYIANSMFVLPEACGQGLATRLIEVSVDLLIHEATSLKAKKVNIGLWVQEGNKGAMKCYEKCGFKFLPHDSSMHEFESKGKVVGMNMVIELPYQ